jgi:hypothetical protein
LHFSPIDLLGETVSAASINIVITVSARNACFGMDHRLAKEHPCRPTQEIADFQTIRLFWEGSFNIEGSE